MTITIAAVHQAERIDPRSDQEHYTLAPDVVLLTVSDGTARLLNLEGYFYGISATGAEMLHAALNQDTATIASNIAAQHSHTDVQQVQADLDRFLEDLQNRGLIYSPDLRADRNSIKARLAALLLAAGLFLIQLSSGSRKATAWMLLAFAYLSIALFGWSTTVAVWQQFSRSDAESSPEDQTTVHLIDAVIRSTAAKHYFDIGCKERSLCCWFLLRRAGLPAKLVLAIDLFPLTSHCWCEFKTSVLTDYLDRCERFTPVLVYQ